MKASGSCSIAVCSSSSARSRLRWPISTPRNSQCRRWLSRATRRRYWRRRKARPHRGRRAMADYSSQTVIRPDIAPTAMTAPEYQVLGQILDNEDVGDVVHFCAGYGPNDLLYLALPEERWL